VVRWRGQGATRGGSYKRVNKSRMVDFVIALDLWDCGTAGSWCGGQRGAIPDMYNVAFPVKEDKKKKKDREKP
jgi:hypothetical protein